MKQPWLRIDFKNWKDEDDDEEDGQGQDLGKFNSIILQLRKELIFWDFQY